VDCDVIVGAAAAALGRAAEREVWAKAKRVREKRAGPCWCASSAHERVVGLRPRRDLMGRQTRRCILIEKSTDA
jgi:hypothetical protein